MVTEDSSRIDIHKSGNLYYLPTIDEVLTNVKYVMTYKPSMKFWVLVTMFMFMHLADAFIQSDLQMKI